MLFRKSQSCSLIHTTSVCNGLLTVLYADSIQWSYMLFVSPLISLHRTTHKVLNRKQKK